MGYMINNKHDSTGYVCVVGLKQVEAVGEEAFTNRISIISKAHESGLT